MKKTGRFVPGVIHQALGMAASGDGQTTKAGKAVSWVVYPMTVNRKPGGGRAVCEQAEWDEMELARPGYHTLVRAGITNEGEAERVARGEPGPVATHRR